MTGSVSLNQNPDKIPSRFKTIDGLRGLAALGVVVYHLAGTLQPELSRLVPSFINTIFNFGYLGVPIFFVISGFVISLSVGYSQISRKYARNFVLRRSIRLDPTYWASIALVVLLLHLKYRFFDPSIELPPLQTILANMFYLQELLGSEPRISVVYWTLCLEVQLYLFFLFSVWLSQRLSSLLSLDKYFIHLAIICGLGVYSICLDLTVFQLSIKGLFVANWHYFLMGVLVSNVVRKLPYSTTIFLAWLALEVAFEATVRIKYYAIAGISCAFLIFFLWKNNLLNIVLGGKTFQYLGKISYTLYLVHPEFGWTFIALCKHFLKDGMTPILAGVIFLAGIFVSIIGAHIFHLLFEKPSLWLCNQLKTKNLRDAIGNRFRRRSITKSEA